MMNRTFHFSDQIQELLFYGCEIKSWPDMVIAIGAVFLTAVVLELGKLLNVKLGQERCKNPLHSVQEPPSQRSGPINDHSITSQSPLLSSLRIPSSVSKIRQRRLKFHALQAVLHIFKVAIGYILMLVAMTYNAYLFITIVLSLTAGYFFLAPLRRRREPRRVPVRHKSLTDSERRSFGASTSSAVLVESAEPSQNPHYGSLYQ